MAKRTAKKSDFAESAHRVWLAGLGAMAAAGEEGEKLFATLVSRGTKYEKKFSEPVEDAGRRVKSTVDDVRTRAGKTVQGVQRAIDDQVTSALHRLGVPTRSEIAKLSERVEKLTQAVESKRSKRVPQPRKKAARKKVPVRKAAGKATKKAASRRPA